MKSFRTLYGGPQMVAAWGMRVRRCVGPARHRFRRMLTGLSVSDASVFKAWADRQPPRVQLAVTWRLGSGE